MCLLYIVHLTRRPVSLRESSGARPNSVVEIRDIHGLGPHASLSSHHESLLLGDISELERLVLVDLRPGLVEMVKVGHGIRNDGSVSVRDDALHGFLVQPRLDDGVLVQLGAEVVPDLLPVDSVALLLLQESVHLVHEVSVCIAVSEVVSLHPAHNVVGVLPATGVDLVASHVIVVIKENALSLLVSRPLSEHAVDQLPRLVRSGVKRLQAVIARTHLGISSAPRSLVSGDVHLRNHADSTHASVLHDLLQIHDGVSLHGGVGTLPPLGERQRLGGIGLRIGDVPVKDIQLGVGHRVDQLLDGGKRLVVASRIHKNTTVVETRSIDDLPRRVLDNVGRGDRVVNNELRNGLESVHRSKGVLGVDRYIRTVIGNDNLVGLVRFHLKLRLSLVHFNVDVADTRLDYGGLTVEDDIHVSLERLNQFVRLLRSEEAEMLSVDRHRRLSVGVFLRKRPDVGHVAAGSNNKENCKPGQCTHTRKVIMKKTQRWIP